MRRSVLLLHKVSKNTDRKLEIHEVGCTALLSDDGIQAARSSISVTAQAPVAAIPLNAFLTLQGVGTCLPHTIVFFSLPFLQFSLPHIIFSLPEDNFSLHPPQIFSTCPIIPRSERVLYSAVTYALSGYINVHCSRPIPAHPARHPNRLATPPRHPVPPGPPPHPARHPHPAPPCPQPQPPTRPDQLPWPPQSPHLAPPGPPKLTAGAGDIAA